MKRGWRDLIGGIFLVPALHLGFLLLILLLELIVGRSSFLETAFFWFFFGIGICQFLYLIPVMLVFRGRGRFEVVKGISIGAILTILVNGACFGGLYSISPTNGELFSTINNGHQLGLIALITVSLMIITFYGFNRRSDKERKP